ncbi:hypothetical protein H010_21896 [Hydrogenophaga taeniospiralis CCUG 15921]|uniref:Uncharacterized protein n=1 Tax=Hydrogenophaga taeniospiralis CCUG 15921 TaxID=1281780 RepID=A0A9X4NWE8_9BURK|nr:hypothetical protein [Hydrogenophaga taeniospiralis]MDG5977921.1 hypothetical protein [Hydrogenophaga taeniospiralis CCUG 15921]
MNAMSPSSAAASAGTSPQELLAQGDARWVHRPSRWRERELAMPWPNDLLEMFCLRMANHGMSVSRTLMQCDRRYALQQLADAHNLADDRLRQMVVQLFQDYEARQSGIRSAH